MTDQNSDSAGELSPKERKTKYKKSLNLPKTSFPMRANLAQNEGQTLKRWNKADLFEAVQARRKDDPVFAFHDGPPFANGDIHIGHMLNKVLKDFVVRSRNLMGMHCHYVPGWDCHGLPIEHKVVTGMVESGKMAKLNDLPVNTRRMAIRRECFKYASKYKKLQAEQMKKLLTLADYENPYLTMTPDYEEKVIEVFAELVEQGLVYRALKPVHWSIANETALADAELEYKDRMDPSIYVCFEAEDAAALAQAFGVGAEAVGDKPSLMIWTTTPWTLPANVLIAVHEEFDYALARVGDRVTVVADELLPKVVELAEADNFEVLAKAKGSELLGLTYKHPFADRERQDGEGQVVAADYVTLEDGTGLVHTAPGHGQEDFDTGRKLGLGVYCPVKGDGSYDDTVPEWLRGKLIWDANPEIIAHLRESGHMFHNFEFLHSYPHDWRSKTPVIFRCTEQWFIAVDQATERDGQSLRELALGAAKDKIEFVPAWGENRLRGMLESRPDWCISRQRSWGLPIPAFRKADGEVLLTRQTVRAVAATFGRKGADAWFECEPAELLDGWDPKADPEAPDDLDVASLEKMYDIFDVWMESGSSWNAVMRARGLGFPTDLYLEGSDQHRGWFQLSLLPSLGATGEPPFKRVLTHGFMVNKDGTKMSKSLGNALNVEDLLKQHGADVLRWWVSSLAFENDIKVDLSYFELAGDSYRKVRNTLRFLLSNLADFDPAEHAVDLASLPSTSLDAWAMVQLAELRKNVFDAFDGLQFRQAHLHLFDFCNETLSAVYLDSVKDRLYCDQADSPRRRATQTVLWHLANTMNHLLAAYLPHTADESHRALHGDGAESIHLGVVPEVVTVELHGGWETVLAKAEDVSKALEAAKADGIENPLDAGARLADEDGVLAAFEADLADLLGVSRVELASEGAVEILDLREEPRCERSWKRDTTVALRADGGYLSQRDADAVGMA